MRRLVLATVFAAAFANSASAEPECTYAGKEYSEGSLLEQEGEIMECKGGSWRKAGG